MLSLMVFALPVALSAPPVDLELAGYLAASGRQQEAARLTVSVLNQQPRNMAAHQLYIRMVRDGLMEAESLEHEYRLWHQEAPESPERRVALAGVLVELGAGEGPWCQEVEALVEPIPKDTGLASWAHQFRYRARATCGGSQQDDAAALVELATKTPTALSFAVSTRLDGKRVDDALAEDLRSLYRQASCSMDEPGDLWADGTKGPGLKRARSDALAMANEILGEDSPACAQAALRVFRRAGNGPGMVAAARRRAELDPGWRSWEEVGEGGRFVPEGGRSRLERTLEGARHRASLEVATGNLKDLEAQVPPHGPLRAMWMKEWGLLQLREGEHDAAFDSFKAGWQENPADRSVANAFAYTAALQGKDLDLALVVMESVLQGTPVYDPWNDRKQEGYDRWSRKTADQVAARMDTRAWILHQLGRTEEAAAALQHALLLAREPNPIYHHHLGMVLHDLGRGDAALQQFGRGLALGPSDEPALDKDAMDLARQLFTEHRWSPGGFENWLETRRADADEQRALACRQVPELPILLNGSEATIGAMAGPRLVVLWSARSRAFLDSMPALEELAREAKAMGVTPVAVSVDDGRDQAASFWEGYETSFLSAWAGPAQELSDLPLTLFVDADGAVMSCHRGRLGIEVGAMERALQAAAGTGR